MERDSHHALSQTNLTQHTPQRPAANSDLDAVLEQAKDQLQLQMLLIEVASCNDSADFTLIARAYDFARQRHEGQHRKSGHPFLQHCVEVARLLAQLRMDDTTVAAGLLHDVIEDTTATYKEVSNLFGHKIADLIDGVTKIDRFTYESREERQAETYRKMLLSMVKDIRVILIKLVDRLHNMRTLDYIGADAQERIARETVEVYAPLAHRFGLARIRWELEDRSLKFLHPEVYSELREKVSMKRREREDYIEEFKKPIEIDLHKSSIEAEIGGRPKNFFSIYNKMKARGKPFEEIYDLLAVRIIVDSMRECYQTLGLVHAIYRPIPERIKDYISMPKSNMYQSLHTSVIGPRGLPVEVQIRTRDMHHTAEIGIAAHWRYKAEDKAPSDLDQHMSWLRQIIDMQQEASDPEEFLENLKIELFQDEIFVFTPQGDLHQFPKGATPIDFAFNVHTDIGMHCLTAKVNGQVVPLSTRLSSGDTVEIVTSSHQSPSRSWLDSVQTVKARQSIRRWLKDEQHAHSVRLGQELLDRELKRFPDVAVKYDLTTIANELDLPDTEHLYAALGSGDLSVGRLIGLLFPQQPKQSKSRKQDKRGIRIQGMSDLMITFGKCCTPIPGDAIIGLITRGRGVTVHRTDCPNIGQISEEPERILQVNWDMENDQAFTVQLRVRSHDRKFLLSDISKALGDSGCNIQSATTRTLGEIAEQDFWVDVVDITHLQQSMEKANKIEGVLEVLRIDEQFDEHNQASKN
ncbi:MAG: bifunctional (p)ppGpp synthetase/guanosine-3',5'-bis(diphosphate) 3'-pyrophosphohydrolase [Candidatus Latescibacterota bacterium]|nr:bifunctional (p)ppGpp synthetase/guanosine-3',5'-bis(diphosphate) 3'-pyrophosphohydrolase [Candidatus Latescibacterota bacterium]